MLWLHDIYNLPFPPHFPLYAKAHLLIWQKVK